MNRNLQSALAKRQCVFVKCGSFSGSNVSIERTLRAHFPEFEVGVIDLLDLLRRRPVPLFLGMLDVVLRKRTALIDGRFSAFERRRKLYHNLLFHIWRSPYMYRYLSGLARKMVAERFPNTAFILQCPSWWDNTIANIPSFIYTDSAMLTNLYYPAFDLDDLAPVSWLRMERQCYDNARRIFVLSQHVRRSFVELYQQPEEKVVIVGAGANIADVPASPAPALVQNKTILFVGVEWDRKGGNELVDAFRRLPERHKDAKLVIVGCSPKMTVNNCSVVGLVPSPQMPSYYRDAAIFCLPTRNEPFGIAFIEAMSYSLAVVAPNLGAMPDYIRHKETGMLHKPQDANGVLECLTWLLDHPEERMAIAARGYDVVSENYTWDAVGRRLREEIGKAIGDDLSGFAGGGTCGKAAS